jgi:uncharacterized protein YukE
MGQRIDVDTAEVRTQATNTRTASQDAEDAITKLTTALGVLDSMSGDWKSGFDPLYDGYTQAKDGLVQVLDGLQQWLDGVGEGFDATSQGFAGS